MGQAEEENRENNLLVVCSFTHVSHGEEVSLACELEPNMWIVAHSEHLVSDSQVS